MPSSEPRDGSPIFGRLAAIVFVFAIVVGTFSPAALIRDVIQRTDGMLQIAGLFAWVVLLKVRVGQIHVRNSISSSTRVAMAGRNLGPPGVRHISRSFSSARGKTTRSEIIRQWIEKGAR